MRYSPRVIRIVDVIHGTLSQYVHQPGSSTSQPVMPDVLTRQKQQTATRLVFENITSIF